MESEARKMQQRMVQMVPGFFGHAAGEWTARCADAVLLGTPPGAHAARSVRLPDEILDHFRAFSEPRAPESLLCAVSQHLYWVRIPRSFAGALALLSLCENLSVFQEP